MKRYSILILLLVVFCVYIRGGTHYFEADDFCRIYQDGVQTNIGSLHRFFSDAGGWFYRPFFKFAYFVNWNIWQLYSPGYHFFSLGIHLINTFLVYSVGKRLFNIRIALTGALIFSLHAVNASSVLWFANTSEILANLFLLTSVWFWIKYLGQLKSKIPLLISSFSYLFALFTKESALITPIILVLVERFYGQKNHQRHPLNKYLIFVVISLGYLILRVLANSHWGGGDYSYKIGLNIPANIIGYIGLLLAGPDFFSSQQELRTAVKTLPWLKQSIIAGLFVFGLIGSVVGYRFRKRLSFLSLRLLDQHRLPLFIIAGFIVSVLPFVLLGNVDARFLYLPSVFWGWAIGFVIFTVKSTWVRKSVVALLALGLLLSIWSIQLQASNWYEAGEMARIILDQTRILKPNVEGGDVFYFENLPDNYNGALVFRNCVDEAMRMMYNEKTLKVYWNQYLPPEPSPQNKIYKFEYTEGNLRLKQ